MKKIWKKKSNIQGDLIDILLTNRSIIDAASFLDPKYENAFDPFLLLDMDKAAARIARAIGDSEKITIYADYDADAVTAAAVLLRFFKKIGHQNFDYYIPDRFTEGYGINEEAIAELSASGTKLIITVDCGINAVSAVAFARSLGIDMVITDHHQLTPHPSLKGEGALPGAAAVVNPHRPGDAYPFKGLTGVGVAFKLVQALMEAFDSASLRSGSNLFPELVEGWEKWLLDLVAIGTVADCTSLLGENRIFVKWGLLVLQKTKWIGLKKLLQVAGLVNTPLDTYHLGFIIAPRLNAAGRIEHANLALDLLLTEDESKAGDLALKLNDLNRHRQVLTEQILSEAREQLAETSHQKILLAAGEGWPKGVVGLVAGKLTEEFYRPVLVLEKSGEHATGSARSIANFNIVEAISKSESILVKYGGHPMAAGFTIKSEHIDIFYKNLLTYADEILTPDDLSPVLEYEAEVGLEEINEELLETLEKFAPFGLGNPRPRLRINNLDPKFPSQIGQEGKHLRMYVSPSSPPLNLRGDRGGLFGCIGFGLGYWVEKLSKNPPIDVICELQFNEWNGQRKIQLKIIDIDFSTPTLSPPIRLGRTGGDEEGVTPDS